MAEKKIMLWPSARSRFINDGNMKILYKALLLLSAFMVVQYVYLYGFVYGVKLALMILVAIVLTRETEILFYSHDKDINRQESKNLIQKSYPELTAVMYALLIPVGTPLWLVGLGAVLATLLGKLLFGGFHHMVFHTSLVGAIVVTLGWSQIVDGVAFMTSFDNFLLAMIFDNSLFNDTFGLGGLYDPTTLGALPLFLTGGSYPIGELFFGISPGVVGSAFVLILMFGYFIVKKVTDWVVPVSAITSFIVTAFIIGLVKSFDGFFAFYYLISGSFLFVAVFIMSDPITTPIPRSGKVVFGIIVGSLTVFIRLAGVYEEGVVFAVLFMNMLTPLLNEVMKEKKTPVKKAVPAKKEGVTE